MGNYSKVAFGYVVGFKFPQKTSDFKINLFRKLVHVKNLVLKKVVCRNSVIGDHVQIGLGSFIENSSILNNVEIGRFAYVLNSVIMDYCSVHAFDHIENSTINRRSSCGPNTRIFNTEIGKFTSVSWNVSIGMPEHTYETVSTSNFIIWPTKDLTEETIIDPYRRGRTVIGNDVWICANAIIKQGIKIGDGAVIGAGAVVTKDIPPYAIAVGVPARVIKYRFSKETIRELRKLQWWNLPDRVIRENVELFASSPENPEVLEKLEQLCEIFN